MKYLKCMLSSIGCALALVSLHAYAAPSFPKAIPGLHIEDGGVYSTNWTVYPIRVEQIDMTSRKPQEMVLGLFEDGKEGGFQGIAQINCEQPVASMVTTGQSGAQQFSSVSIKDMMKNDVLPRKLVNNIFAMFCKDANLSAADLNVSRE